MIKSPSELVWQAAPLPNIELVPLDCRILVLLFREEELSWAGPIFPDGVNWLDNHWTPIERHGEVKYWAYLHKGDE